MGMIETLSEALKTHDDILVFTQNDDLIRKFFLDGPGRWNILINEKWHKKEAFQHEKIYQGKTKEGYKIGAQWTADKRNPGIIAKSNSSTGRILFCKNAFWDVQSFSFIVKDRFSFPKIKTTAHLPPIMAIQKEKPPIAIVCESAQQYHNLHDQLVMQEIDHSLDTSGEFKPIHLMLYPRYIEGYDKAIIYGFKPVSAILPFHNFEQLIWVRQDDVRITVNWEKLQMLLRCFAEAPDSALSTDYFAMKTLLHPSTIDRNLLFLLRCGVVSRVLHNDAHVILHKNRAIPNDLDFAMIPEGEYSVQKLLTHMKIPREDLFPLLKRYEGQGLIFSYSPKRIASLWKFERELSREKFHESLEALQGEDLFLSDLIQIGEIELDRYLERTIQRHCLANNKTAVILQEEAEDCFVKGSSQSLADSTQVPAAHNPAGRGGDSRSDPRDSSAKADSDDSKTPLEESFAPTDLSG